AKLNVRTIVSLFNYSVNAPRRSDVRRMPVDLLAYIVDLEITADQIEWVHDRYSGVATPGVAFFDVPYDESALYDTAPNAPPERARTLMNLQRRGGACPDAAYYAAQIGKTLGVPAAACRASAVSSGSPPAWVGFVKAGA